MNPNRNDDEAWLEFEEWYEYNGKYEGCGHSFDMIIEIFNDWLESR